MPDEISIRINTKHLYTQSPSTVIDATGFVDENGVVQQQVFDSRQILVPSIRVSYHPDPTQAAGWQIRFVELSKLKDGWNGYNAPAPSEHARLTARSFVDILLKDKYEPKRVAPSAVGGVAVTQRKNNRKVYVEFFNDGTVFALFSDGSSEPVSKEIVPSYQSFKNLVKQMREYLDAGNP